MDKLDISLWERIKIKFSKEQLIKHYNLIIITFGRKEDIIKPTKSAAPDTKEIMIDSNKT